MSRADAKSRGVPETVGQSDQILNVRNLSVEFYQGSTRAFHAVVDANVSVGSGEMVGMVGESGCGKTLSALALLGLTPPAARCGGTIEYRSNAFQADSRALKKLRGRQIGMIFQEPMTALNPVFSLDRQFREALRYLRGIHDRRKAHTVSVELLDRVGLERPERRLAQFPHQLSGGQRQRAMIALALAGEPDILVADEPTTALDATLERRIMDLFRELANEGLGILMISHDLPLVAEVSDRIVVMYSGYTVETGPAIRLTETPQHPYTRGLLASASAIFSRERGRLPVIPGEVPSPEHRPSGCPFHPRCPEREARCDRDFPPDFEPVSGLRTACWAREADG